MSREWLCILTGRGRHLGELRAEQSLRTAADELGVSRGLLSEIERGQRLPAHVWIASLEETYGAPAHEWCQPAVLLALQRDASSG